MALTNLWKRIHGKRLAQGSEFLMELSKPGAVDTCCCSFSPHQQLIAGPRCKPCLMLTDDATPSSNDPSYSPHLATTASTALQMIRLSLTQSC